MAPSLVTSILVVSVIALVLINMEMYRTSKVPPVPSFSRIKRYTNAMYNNWLEERMKKYSDFWSIPDTTVPPLRHVATKKEFSLTLDRFVSWSVLFESCCQSTALAFNSMGRCFVLDAFTRSIRYMPFLFTVDTEQRVTMPALPRGIDTFTIDEKDQFLLVTQGTVSTYSATGNMTGSFVVPIPKTTIVSVAAHGGIVQVLTGPFVESQTISYQNQSQSVLIEQGHRALVTLRQGVIEVVESTQDTTWISWDGMQLLRGSQDNRVNGKAQYKEGVLSCIAIDPTTGRMYGIDEKTGLLLIAVYS